MSSSLSQSSSSSAPLVQEFSITVPKTSTAKYNMMRFNHVSQIDFSMWNHVKMERENNKLEKNPGEEVPKFGAGSEFRREEKEEARRKKFGYAPRRYNPNDQPWILKYGGKGGKKFRGVREGGVNDNSSYYVFMHGANNVIQAFPVAEWYNFIGIQRFKALTVEEAEEQYGKRNKSIAYFSEMMVRRMKKDEEEEQQMGVEESSQKKSEKDKSFKISDMDDWIGSEDDENSENEEIADTEDGEVKPKKQKKKQQAKKVANKKKQHPDNDGEESAFEESDDGDEEGRELDYISDSSDSESDSVLKVEKELKGVAEEVGLRKLLTSDEEDEEEEEDKKEEEKETQEGNSNAKGPAEEKSKVEIADILKNRKRKGSPNDGDYSTDSEAEKNSQSPSDTSKNSSQTSKKLCLDTSIAAENGITEEAVRRYLSRKPMTTTELLHKFKKTNLSSQQLMQTMIMYLKRINPHRQFIKDKMYLSILPESST